MRHLGVGAILPHPAMRLVFGLLKGGILGAALGLGAAKLGLSTLGAPGYLLCGAVGAVVGIFCGTPPWRQEAFWTWLLKGVFGFGIGAALFWVAGKFLGGLHLPLASLGVPDAPAVQIPYLLGPAIGMIWGAFVEIDDGGRKEPDKAGGKAEAPAKAPPAAKK